VPKMAQKCSITVLHFPECGRVRRRRPLRGLSARRTPTDAGEVEIRRRRRSGAYRAPPAPPGERQPEPWHTPGTPTKSPEIPPSRPPTGERRDVRGESDRKMICTAELYGSASSLPYQRLRPSRHESGEGRGRLVGPARPQDPAEHRPGDLPGRLAQVRLGLLLGGAVSDRTADAPPHAL